MRLDNFKSRALSADPVQVNGSMAVRVEPVGAVQVELGFNFLSGAIFFSRGVLAAKGGVAEGFEFVAVTLRHGQRGERWERARDVFPVRSVRLLHVAGVAENLDVSGACLARVKGHSCGTAHSVMALVDGADAVERE